MSQFESSLAAEQQRLKELVASAVDKAMKSGADQSHAAVVATRGISVSSRDQDVENIEFNNYHGMEITVYKDHRKGSASTNDLRPDAINEAVASALSIASYADQDPFAGICDPDLQCTEFRDLKDCFPVSSDPDAAVKRVVDLDRLAQKELRDGIKASDGASFDNSLSIDAIANSNGFCASEVSTSAYMDLTLLGDSDGKMQRGSGYTSNVCLDRLRSPEEILAEAAKKTRDKLGAKPVKTGRYNIIFTPRTAYTLWGHLMSAISGYAQYQKMSFLLGARGKTILPGYLTYHEDPFVEGRFGSYNFDQEGVRTAVFDLVKDGVLQDYLLGSYSARKLGLRSNGHSGRIYNGFVIADEAHTRDYDSLIKETGEGLIVTDLMGQGVDGVSGNYSRGAAGFYFKDGQIVHPVEEVTIAGNLKQMFEGIALVGNDYDERLRIQTGSVMIPEMTVSGI